MYIHIQNTDAWSVVPVSLPLICIMEQVDIYVDSEHFPNITYNTTFLSYLDYSGVYSAHIATGIALYT